MGSFVVKSGCNGVTITTDDTHPNILYVDRDVDAVLVQISHDHFAVRKGHWYIGDVHFYNGTNIWGWHFSSRCAQFRNSRKFHPFPEAALRGKVTIRHAYINGTGNNTGFSHPKK